MIMKKASRLFFLRIHLVSAALGPQDRPDGFDEKEEEIVPLVNWPQTYFLFFFLRPGLTSGYKRFPLPPSVDSRPPTGVKERRLS